MRLYTAMAFGEETVADKNLREAFEIIDGLESFALANVKLADGHQGDLIARFEFQNLLVFGDSLGDFALVQELLSGLDEFAFVISHAPIGTARAKTAMQVDSPQRGLAESVRDSSPRMAATRTESQRYPVTLAGGKKTSQ